MAINIQDASGGAGSHAASMREGARPGRESGQAFLEAFRRLPDKRFHKMDNGLEVATVREGQGKPLTSGAKIKVKYTGWLADGTKFDSSMDHDKLFEFTLGAGRVIKGWEEGLMGIRPGERRQIVIPPKLGYGDRQVGKIPPGSTLIFNVEAVAVDEPPGNPKGTMSVVA